MKPNKYNYNNQTGMYRNKVLIQKRIIQEDDRKQQTSTFVDFGFYFSMKKTQKFDEIESASNEKMYVLDRFVIKYSKHLNDLIESEGTSIRIVHGNLNYDVISAVNDNGLNETITFIAKREGISNE